MLDSSGIDSPVICPAKCEARGLDGHRSWVSHRLRLEYAAASVNACPQEGSRVKPRISICDDVAGQDVRGSLRLKS